MTMRPNKLKRIVPGKLFQLSIILETKASLSKYCGSLSWPYLPTNIRLSWTGSSKRSSLLSFIVSDKQTKSYHTDLTNKQNRIILT